MMLLMNCKPTQHNTLFLKLENKTIIKDDLKKNANN